MRACFFLTVVVVSPMIVILIPGRQSPSFLLCSLGSLLVGLVEPPVLPGADVGCELCALGGLEGSDRIMRRDMRRVVRRAELCGAGVVEGVGELLAGGDVEHFSEFGALRDTDGWSSLFVSSPCCDEGDWMVIGWMLGEKLTFAVPACAFAVYFFEKFLIRLGSPLKCVA